VPNKGAANFPVALKLKAPLICKAAEKLLDDSAFSGLRDRLAAFRKANAWVEESALFDCLRRERSREGKCWWEWEPALRDREAGAIKEARKKHKRAINVFIATQFLFDVQWAAVKVRCGAAICIACKRSTCSPDRVCDLLLPKILALLYSNCIHRVGLPRSCAWPAVASVAWCASAAPLLHAHLCPCASTRAGVREHPRR
jgi:4-alpha-glucanotransferase